MNRVTVIALALAILVVHSLGIHQTQAGEFAPSYERSHVAFRLGRIGMVSTAIYSIDRSLFQRIARGATQRRLVRNRCSVALAGDGSVVGEPEVAVAAS